MIKKLLICIIILYSFTLSAKEYSVAIYQLPTSDAFVNLFKVMGETTNNSFNTQIVPPARGVYLIENNQVDIVFPATVSSDPKKTALSKFDYSTVKVFKAVFVLYMNKNKLIDITELKNGNPRKYKIETTGSLAQLFEFQSLITTSLEASLKKVEESSIDGLLYAQEAGDPMLKNLGLKNILRKLYSTNDIAFGIKKGSVGGEIDKMLLEGVLKLKNSGKLNQIIAVSIKNSIYDNWQP